MNQETSELVVNELKHALATEYFAANMYHTAYYKCRGTRRIALLSELWEHYKEEVEHIDILEQLIAEYNGTTFSDPTEWKEWAIGNIPAINNSSIDIILETIEQSEQLAVDMYTNLVKAVAEYPVIQDALIKILAKETEHLFEVVHTMKGR